jgi:hypothetical protein
MIRYLLIAIIAVAAFANLTFVSQPVEAASCATISAKARGLNDESVWGRAEEKLKRKVSHWANKNGISPVRVGETSTSCSKGPVYTCTSSVKACG